MATLSHQRDSSPCIAVNQRISRSLRFMPLLPQRANLVWQGLTSGRAHAIVLFLLFFLIIGKLTTELLPPLERLEFDPFRRSFSGSISPSFRVKIRPTTSSLYEVFLAAPRPSVRSSHPASTRAKRARLTVAKDIPRISEIVAAFGLSFPVWKLQNSAAKVLATVRAVVERLPSRKTFLSQSMRQSGLFFILFMMHRQTCAAGPD